MQELMDEKISHNLPLEKLLGEESKNRHRSKKRVIEISNFILGRIKETTLYKRWTKWFRE